jgi:hypothetical protein
MKKCEVTTVGNAYPPTPAGTRVLPLHSCGPIAVLRKIRRIAAAGKSNHAEEALFPPSRYALWRTQNPASLAERA